MMNQQFDKDFKAFIYDFLTEQGVALANEQKQRIRSAGIRRTGELVNSPAYEVTKEQKTGNYKLTVRQRFYGRIINKAQIAGIGRKGKSKGKAIPPEALKQWIKEVGIQNFAAKHKGKSQQRMLNDIAWGLSKAWAKRKKRKGKPWGYNEMKNYIANDLEDEMVVAYQEFMQNNIV
jgi:hypothetical protein